MSFELERSTVESYFRTEWKKRTTYPIAYEGVTFNPPTDQSPYCELHILRGDGFQASLGDNPLYRYPGVIQVTCSVLAGSGTRLLTTMADWVKEIFRGKQIDCGSTGWIDFLTTSMTPPREGNGRLEVYVSTPYRRNE